MTRPGKRERALARQLMRQLHHERATLVAGNLNHMSDAPRSNVRHPQPETKMHRARYVGGWDRPERGSYPHNSGGH